jgi:hypothetical protein
VPHTRPLLALLTSLCLLFGLPVAGAAAKHKSSHAKRHHCAKAAKRKHKAKHCRKHHAKRKPATGNVGAPVGPADDVERMGTITAIDGELVTVTADDGSVLTGAVTEDTDLSCTSAAATDPDDPADDDDGTDPLDPDDADDPDDPDEEEPVRSAGLCVPAVGDVVLDAELDEAGDPPLFLVLDLLRG